MIRNSIVLMLATCLAACVTIHIYFPAAAAQEVADEIIDDVWQLKSDEKANTPQSKNSEPEDPVDTESK